MNCLDVCLPDSAWVEVIMEDRMTAYCGKDCLACPVHQATMEGSEALRSWISSVYLEHFDRRLESVRCEGCLSDGCLPGAECKVRRCAVQLGIKSCAECDEYPCGRLEGILAGDPEALDCLNALR